MSDPDVLDALDERALRMIVRGTLAFTGEELLRSLVRELAVLLGARNVAIGELADGGTDRIRTRAMWRDGAYAPSTVYSLGGTPCAEVIGTGPCFITTGARAQFPTDPMLVELDAESYFGTPLMSVSRNDDGRAMGVLCVAHDRALEDTPAIRSILTIFATRAAAELARLHADAKALEDAEALLRARSALLGLAQRDDDDLHVSLNAIVATDGRTMGVERVSYWSLASDRSHIVCEALHTTSTGTFERGAVLYAVEYPRYFEALLSSRAIAADDAVRDPRTREFDFGYFGATGITSMLDVPVWHRGQLAGVVCHEHVGPPRVWSTAEQDFALAIAGLVAVAVAASERRRAEDRNRMIARATNDVLWDWDLASNSLAFSESVMTTFGYAAAEVEHTISWWLRRIHADDVERVSASIEEALADPDRTSWSDEYRFVRGDGSAATVTDRGIITRDDRKMAVRMIGAMVDVTERRSLEARLTVADRMASLGTLAAGIAHEVNNPLAYILANVDYALDELGEQPSMSDVVEGLREARQGAARVREIVRDLKTFSRSDVKRERAIEIGPVIESSINMAWNEIRHRARLVRELRPTPKVDASEARLGQVAINLLVNAAQAFPEGDLETHEIRVVTHTDARGWAVIEVRDNGPGMTAEVKSRIFDPFFTTKSFGGGTGLGLSICHSIVSACGGEISVESAPGRGCSIRVALPAAADQSHRAHTVAPAPPELQRPSVLIIDDDPHVGAAIRRMISRECDVETLHGARAGLARLASGAHVDVVVCDLMMPDMTGMELYAELERTQPDRLASLVFMTGGAFTTGARDFLAKVPSPRLEKPFTKDAILGMIQRAVDAGRAVASRR